MTRHLVTALIALIFGFVGAGLFSLTGISHQQTRDYLVANPEILPEMADAFQSREAQDRLTKVSDEVRTPFPGAVLGNPNGSHTLVKFSDYACGFCRISVADVERLVKADPNLRVVIREWPIFEGSDISARMALAAANQGKYAQFHKAVFALGQPTEENVMLAARKAGLDIEAAQKFAASEAVSAELARNQEFASQLGFSGTPSWIAGDTVLEGAIGYDGLKDALGS